MPVSYGSLPFLEALAFFRAKLNLPTQKWDDLLGAAHDRAFVVAGAMKADLLADLKAAIDKAIAEGATIETFRKDFKRIVAERGWTGWTGEGAKAGEAWRTRVLYETNLFSSYSAGRTQQMKAVAETRPYWRYRHSPASTVPRAEHLAWDGLILRHDDPWFASHTPPNGFGCKCYLETLAERDLQKQGLAVTPKGQIPYNALDPKTGLPQGVDKGWDYQPGASVANGLARLGQQAMNKAVTLPPLLAAQAVAAHLSHPAILNAVSDEFGAWANAWFKELDAAAKAKAARQKYAIKTTGELRHVGALSENVLAELAKRQIAPASALLSVRDEDLIHTFRDTKVGPLPRSWYERLPEHLRQPKAVLLDTSHARLALLYIYDMPSGTGKLVVEIDYLITERGADGKKITRPANIINTARMVPVANLKAYGKPLEGTL
ncbi:MAG TPA: phage minor head protein [Candidatus Contendobacter sp.]|nr:phage minor head protein [Candidatus Contendobacter sp.]